MLVCWSRLRYMETCNVYGTKKQEKRLNNYLKKTFISSGQNDNKKKEKIKIKIMKKNGKKRSGKILLIFISLDFESSSYMRESMYIYI